MSKMKDGGLDQYGALKPLTSSNLEQLALKGLISRHYIIPNEQRATCSSSSPTCMLPWLAATLPGRTPATNTPNVSPPSSSLLTSSVVRRPISSRPSCLLPEATTSVGPGSSRMRTISPGSARPYSDASSSERQK